ncbi:NAD(P)-binding protein [Xylaria bambusicola]|uniref:NAD(P)-binding protein n=1 Tax=Xylaria bambusicola TaxID=326684 RepID=UPI0020079421|nr:NAD(P)-binding protein [Xylaria bambusicola]KAI0521077.1 NAD(P)-binding protein [Xylaria bambusicola]
MPSSLLYSPVLDLGPALREVFLSPLLSGPLLLAVTYAPDAVRELLSNIAIRLPALQGLLSNLDPSTAVTTLRLLFAVSGVHWLNRALNEMAANSWRLTASKGWDWPNEIAVVTGGSSGIGKLTVEKLAAHGLRVAVLDIQDLPKSMETNTRIRFFRCDVTSSESVAETAGAVRREIGHPSILINNAGITSPCTILKMSEAYLRKIFGVNSMSHWFTVQQFLPHMIQMNKGHVITIASLASFVALPTAADYSASKAAALSFHEALTCELKHCYEAPNVMTTVVHPNYVRTPLLDNVADHLENSGVRMLTSEQVAEPIVRQILSRRAAQIIIPTSMTMASAIRGWPTWLQELIRDTLGRSSLKS